MYTYHKDAEERTNQRHHKTCKQRGDDNKFAQFYMHRELVKLHADAHELKSILDTVELCPEIV